MVLRCFGSFWLFFFGGFRWFWMILAGFGWFNVLVTTLKGNIEVT